MGELDDLDDIEIQKILNPIFPFLQGIPEKDAKIVIKLCKSSKLTEEDRTRAISTFLPKDNFEEFKKWKPEERFLAAINDRDVQYGVIKLLNNGVWPAVRVLIEDENLIVQELFETVVEFRPNSRNTVSSLAVSEIIEPEISHQNILPCLPSPPSTPFKCKEKVILLLGDTGTGKSTFINALANYVTFSDWQNALDNPPIVRIPTEFSLRDSNLKECVRIRMEKSSVNFPEQFENYGGEKGASVTQDAVAHWINWTSDDEEQSLCIIDTPGFSDTRGQEQNNKNFNGIVRFLSKFPEIHAICLLVRTNGSRFTKEFCADVKKFLSVLEPSAAKNLVYCFTNSKENSYYPGDSLALLQNGLEDVNGKSQDIGTFAFENDNFRFLCANSHGQGSRYEKSEDFAESWKKSRAVAKELISHLREMKPYQLANTLKLNTFKTDISALAGPLMEVFVQQIMNQFYLEENIAQLEEKIKKPKKKSGVYENNKSLFLMQMVSLNIKETENPMMVCTNECCIDWESGNHGQEVPIFKICHEKCIIPDVKLEKMPQRALINCQVMNGANFSCSVCGCNWQHHMHVKKRVHRVFEEDGTAPGHISLDSLKEIHQRRERELAKLSQEIEILLDCLATLAAFLFLEEDGDDMNPFGFYLKVFIDRERKGDGDAYLVEQLESARKSFNKKVTAIIDDSHKTIGLQEAQNVLKDLSTLEGISTLRHILDLRTIE